jgi:hypothetical protein
MKSLFAACILGLAANIACAGVVFETVIRDSKSGKSESAERWYAQDGNARIEGADGISIFRDGAVYALDPSDRSYHVMDKATMEQLSARVKQKRAEGRAQMQAELSKLPPEKRAAAEAKLAQQGLGPEGLPRQQVDARDTGKAESINGRPCHVWDIVRDGALDEQFCVAPFASLPGGDEIQALMRSYEGFFEQMAELMSGPVGSGARDTMRDEFALWKKLDGFPLATRGYAHGVLEDSETVVATWKSKTVPAAMFDVPSNYTKRDLIKDLETASGK